MKILASLLLLAAASQAADWPQWRGLLRDGHAGADEAIKPEAIQNPKISWKLPIGGGFSGPIITGDRVIYIDEDGKSEVARAVSLETGKELWKTPFAEMYGDEWGKGPRSTPFADGERVWVQSCNGEFRCLDLKDGRVIWGFSFESHGVKFLGSKAREGTASRRGNNGAGLLDGDAVIVPVGAPGASLVCLGRDDGTLRWKAGDDEAAYSSLMVGNLAGARQVVALTADALLGADRITGKTLWRVPLRTNAKRHTMTPVLSGSRIFVNSHTFGTVCFEITNVGGEFKAAEAWRNEDLKINLATPVLSADGRHLYSHGADKNFACVDAATGRQLWSEPGFGQHYSSALAAGGSLFVLSDSGEGILIQPSPEKFIELARAQMAGKNWNHPALGHGRLVVRDQRELICYLAR